MTYQRPEDQLGVPDKYRHPRSESELLGVVTPAEPASCDHDFEFVVTAAGDLVRLLCANCGAQWKVEPV